MNQDIVKIHVPNTKFWIRGEKITRDTWNMYLVQPGSDYKELVRKNVTTKVFIILSNVTLKTPFPHDG
ncbi:MAG: hypothetical protein V1649_01950 [Patescibacteria group bacterium]